LPGNVIGGLSPRRAAELDQYKENGRNCGFHPLFLSLSCSYGFAEDIRLFLQGRKLFEVTEQMAAFCSTSFL
jgi:hypothetical protein